MGSGQSLMPIIDMWLDKLDGWYMVEVMKTSKITFKIVRSFGIGFRIHSPTLNGLSFEIDFACLSVSYWGKGKTLVSARNYWNGHK